MIVINNLDHPLDIINPVVAVGSFDGVHLGHVEILNRVKSIAKENGGKSVIVTFEPHPHDFFNTKRDFFRINTKEKKISLIEEQKIDYLIILNFDKKLSLLSFEDFMVHILKDKIKTHTLVMGPNHHFGKDKSGNYETIKAQAEQLNIQVVNIPEYKIENNNVRSEIIRNLIKKGSSQKAEYLLGKK